MAESAVSFLIEYLGSLLDEKSKLLKGVRGEARNIRDELESILSFLRDADARQDTDEGIKTWVKQVREAAYDAEDVLDKFILRLAQQQHDAYGVFAFLRKPVHSIKQLKSRYQIAKEIQGVRTQLQHISRRRNDYNLQRVEQGSSSNNLNNRGYNPRLDALFVEETELVGIDVPKNQLIGWLLSEERRLSTISVVGMGGLGKTTLVKKVYDSEEVKRSFGTYAWITVSQTFTEQDLLQSMATQFYEAKKQQAPSGLDAMTYVQLIQMLRDYLQKERYVLVLDDVWSTNVWKFMCNALPAAQEYGSRVIVTTRTGEVASYCRSRPSDHIHNLEPLRPEHAWSLFCRKAFPLDEGNACPPELKELSQIFVHKCRGLPLAIVTLAGLLSIKEQRYAEWEMIHRSLGTKLESDDNLKSMKKILMLSYNELPYHLKSCFLYLSIFPEDYLIKRMKLIRLWIAEGFVEHKDSQMSPEEVAESYLNTLITRNLIQVAERRRFGKVISCRVHDLVHEMIISKFKEEHFFTSSGLQNTYLSDKIRRLSIDKKSETAINYENCSRLRSLFIFGLEGLCDASFISSFSGLRLLRVVDLENVTMQCFPEVLTSLFHLRYLSLENTKIKNLPNSVGKLINLEILNLKGSYICELPAQILKLQHLRHLQVYHYVTGISL